MYYIIGLTFNLYVLLPATTLCLFRSREVFTQCTMHIRHNKILHKPFFIDYPKCAVQHATCLVENYTMHKWLRSAEQTA